MQYLWILTTEAEWKLNQNKMILTQLKWQNYLFKNRYDYIPNVKMFFIYKVTCYIIDWIGPNLLLMHSVTLNRIAPSSHVGDADKFKRITVQQPLS